MDIPDSNLNKAHRFMRYTQNFEKFGQFDQAKIYHVKAIVSLKKALEETDNESAKTSIQQQIEHQKIVLNLMKQKKILKNNFEIAETRKKFTSNFVSDELTNSIINVIDEQKKLIQHFLDYFKHVLNEKNLNQDSDQELDDKQINTNNFDQNDQNIKNGLFVLKDLVSANDLIKEGTSKIIQEMNCLKKENFILKSKVDQTEKLSFSNVNSNKILY